MSDELSSSVKRLLEHERARPQPGPEVEARVLEKLTQSMLTAPLGADAPSSPAAAAPASVSGLGAVKLVLAAVIGAGAGAGLHATFRAPEVRVVEVVRERVVEVPVPVAPAPVEPVAEPVPPIARKPPVVKPSPPAPTVPPPKSDQESSRERDRALAAERMLIEQARTSLARQNPAEALAALNEHRQRFADGQLGEEREGLEVLALFAAGEIERAKTAAAEFRRRFPQSVLLRSIRRAEETSAAH